MARRHRFRGFGEGGSEHASIAGPLIGGGATQIGIMLAHLHARKNPKALRHAGLHGAVLGGLVAGALAFSKKHRETGISALVTVGVIAAPRILEGLMGLGHREETAMRGALGIITPEEYHALAGAGEEPMVQLLDSGAGGGVLGTHVAEEIHPLGASDAAVEVLGNSGFGTNFLSQ
jgi:hypothetical protein